MGKTIVFMFSGQGSQYYQMGKELFIQNPVFRKWMIDLDDIAKSLIGESVLDELYSKNKRRNERFDRILFTNPSIFMVEYAMTKVLQSFRIWPDFVVGSSVGEFAAAAVAGIISVEEALEMLVEQSVLLEAHCQRGSMLAILSGSGLYHEVTELASYSELVSVNYDSHFVVSGQTDNIQRIKALLDGRRVICEVLPVAFAFHSSFINPIKLDYKLYLNKKSYRNPQIAFVSSLHGKQLSELSIDYFWDVIREPIQFSNAIEQLEKKGNHAYLDLGPAGTLANFAKRSVHASSQSQFYSILTPFNQDYKNLKKMTELYSRLPKETLRKDERSMKTFVFSGQGSQYKGMGGTLFDEFKELTDKANQILGYSIKDLCLNDPFQQLSKTQFTQPAIYTVNALSFYKALQERNQIPDYVAGHSLGEYNALLAAGAFDFETGLRLVQKRGELMSKAIGGGMAAVVGFSIEQVTEVLMEFGLTGIDIANHNTPSQIVIAGLKADIVSAQPIFERAGVKMYIPLNVSGAFHSRYMADSQKEFEAFLNKFEFSRLTIPVISNVQGMPYLNEEVKRNLLHQITHQVKWTDSIRYLLGLDNMEIEEVGPGNVLAKLVAGIRKEATPLVITPVIEAKKEGIEPRNPIIASSDITAYSLGSEQFRKDYGLTYAYATGAMYRGIASAKMVVKMGKAGMMGFYGTGGITMGKVEEVIQFIQKELSCGEAYGMNLLHNPGEPLMEEQTVELFLKYGVTRVEASAYMGIVSALVLYRAKGLKSDPKGGIIIKNHIIAKLSRPEVAEAFLSPAPERIIEKLLRENKITGEEAILVSKVPMADDLCVEADSGGHTDLGVAYALMPAITKLREEKMNTYGYAKRIRVGAAGGIGTPEAAAAAFMLGADFIVTGSINQCTVEADTSNVVKDLLQQANVQDTDYAPAGDMFEIGAKVQVLKKGLFFPVRANKLYDLYRHYNSLEEIDDKTKKMIQEKYFNRSFEDVYKDVKAYQPPHEIEKAERNPKYKMMLIFKWYFGYSTRLAMTGNLEHKVDYQIHCGPALGAFNQWVKGTPLEDWRNRHVDALGIKLMTETADLLNKRFLSFKCG